MIFNNPKVVFTFPNGDVIQTTDIVKDSLKFDLQIMKELDSSSNIVKFTLSPSPVFVGGGFSLNGRLISEEGDILSQVYDGGTLLYTGYVSRTRSWTVGNRGNGTLEISLEDVGIRKLKGPCSEKTTVYRDTVSNIVNGLVMDAGISIAEGNPTIDAEAYVSLEPTMNADSFINTILKEYGYCYYFNERGEFCLSCCA